MSPEPAGSEAAGAADATASAGNQRRRLSEELQFLIESFAERPVSLREVLGVLHTRGFTVLLIVLAFPFCTPIPLPGVSIPFGVVIAFVGLRLALGQKPWLPARLLDTRLPPKFFPRLLAATRRIVRFLEYFLRPRLVWFVRWRIARNVAGAMILVCGFLMVLPFPIPFSNGLPAMTVLLLAAATLEEDGYVAVAGGVLFLVSLTFFGVLFWGGAEAVSWIKDGVGGLLPLDDAQSVP